MVFMSEIVVQSMLTPSPHHIFTTGASLCLIFWPGTFPQYIAGVMLLRKYCALGSPDEA